MTRLTPTRHDLKNLMREYFENCLVEAFYDCGDRRGMFYGAEPDEPSEDPYGLTAIAEGEYRHQKSLATTYGHTEEQQQEATDLLLNKNFDPSNHDTSLAELLMEANIEAKRIKVAYLFSPTL